jgi:N-terminal C2 in EEIG1 and EHBP1 proteins
MEHYQIHVRVISMSIPASSTLFQTTHDSLMGVYFKIKRGSNRMNGKNRYALYATEDTTLIDETFDCKSVFFKKTSNFQQKIVGVKLKQEVSGGKDRVLGKANFDVARFVGKEGIIYEMNLECQDSNSPPRITMEITVTKPSSFISIQSNGGGNMMVD